MLIGLERIIDSGLPIAEPIYALHKFLASDCGITKLCLEFWTIIIKNIKIGIPSTIKENRRNLELTCLEFQFAPLFFTRALATNFFLCSVYHSWYI